MLMVVYNIVQIIACCLLLRQVRWPSLSKLIAAITRSHFLVSFYDFEFFFSSGLDVCVCKGIQFALWTDRLFTQSRFDRGGPGMSRLFPAKNCRSSGHRIFRAAEKGQPGVIPPSVPSHRHGGIDMDGHQIPTRRPFHLHRFHQFNHSHCYVLILLDNGVQSKVQEQCLVEKVHNPNANCKCSFPYVAVNLI